MLSPLSINVQRTIPEFQREIEGQQVDPVEDIFSMEDHHEGELVF